MSLNVLRVKCRHATVLQQDLLFTVLPPKNRDVTPENFNKDQRTPVLSGGNMKP